MVTGIVLCVWRPHASQHEHATPTSGRALHSCGPAADAVLAACTRARARFVVAPCCYGFVQASVEAEAEELLRAQTPTETPTSSAEVDGSSDGGAAEVTEAAAGPGLRSSKYPRSAAFRRIDGCSAEVFGAIAGLADATYFPGDARYETHDALARGCMDAVRCTGRYQRKCHHY